MVLTIVAFLVSFCFAQSQNLHQGDMYYDLRAENSKNNTANDKNIKEAIKYYRLALDDSKEREEAAWKLLRAYYFQGCFTMSKKKDKVNLFAQSKKEGKALFDEFPKNPEVAYWYSVNIALWSSLVNPFTALNAGSVKETMAISKKLIAMEKTDKKAAARGYQILGRAHQRLPNIAFVLNWVKRDSAEFYLKKALTLDSEDLATHLFLAENYKENGNKKEAENFLSSIIKFKPRISEFLEDERNLIKMRKLLE